MSNLYLTADQVGLKTGGGLVTAQESLALQSMGPCEVWGREQLKCEGEEPWKWDEYAFGYAIGSGMVTNNKHPDLCHIYAGTFSKTVALLKHAGSKVVITCAAHSIEISKREHEKLGFPFPYTHLTDPALWKRYSQGYMDCDVLVCPSSVAAETCRKQGRTGRIEIIPHGCDLPEKIKPPPKRFVVGYMGSFMPDKGIVYLLQAWKKLNYKEALLVLAGRDSTSSFVSQMISMYGGGNIYRRGWVNSIADFYGGLSLYVQPSMTEGYGIEVAEAMAHGRLVLCSTGAGAVDMAEAHRSFTAGDIDMLAHKIDTFRRYMDFEAAGLVCREIAKRYAWDTIRQRYIDLWKTLL